MKTTDNGGCPLDCGHTAEEHAAFDRGVKDGEALGYDAECPAEYRGTNLEETWEIGRSVNSRFRSPDSLRKAP
jgi:hypothetical protein